MLFKVLLFAVAVKLAVGSTRWNEAKVARVLHKRNLTERVEVSEFFELRVLKTVNSTAPTDVNEEMKEKVGVKKASNDEKERFFNTFAIKILGVLSLPILLLIFILSWAWRMERMTRRAVPDTSVAIAFWYSVRRPETPTPPSPPPTPPSPPPTPPRTPPPPYKFFAPPSYEDVTSGRIVCPVLIAPVHSRPS